MSEAGPLDLDFPSIYLFEVGADEKEGRRRYFAGGHTGGRTWEGSPCQCNVTAGYKTH